MPDINWSTLAVVEIPNNTLIYWPWKMALDSYQSMTHLKIVSEGEWEETTGQIKPFSPDGHAGVTLQPEQLVLKDSPVGSLIGKIGGSSADCPRNVDPTIEVIGRAFSLGSYCIVPVPTGSVGALFFSFNWIQRPIKITKLRITVSGAALSV
jgi:hypothetical protein